MKDYTRYRRTFVADKWPKVLVDPSWIEGGSLPKYKENCRLKKEIRDWLENEGKGSYAFLTDVWGRPIYIAFSNGADATFFRLKFS